MSLHSISDTIHRAFEAAGLDMHAPNWKTLHETVRQALGKAGLAAGVPAAAAATRSTARGDRGAKAAPTASANGSSDTRAPGTSASVQARYSGPAGTRDYTVFVPSVYRGQPMPLVMMLHGCQQSPDDFAAGTRMNAFADRLGFLVVYPAQSTRANGSNCWNWFQARDQRRDGGEPEILAGIVREVQSHYAVDSRRVFAAGLSAGASMAVILGTTHPELFAAIGVHSGLPYGAAHDVASAFAAMHGGGQVEAPSGPRIPMIVFHGDQDHTVVDANGEAIVRQAVTAFEADGRRLVRAQTVRPASDRSRAAIRTVHAARDGRPLVEHWQLKGGTHAWSGGDAAGSYTDTLGPDASDEMLRFFLQR